MTKSEIFKSIQREYDNDRTEAEYRLKERKAKLYKKLPRLAEIQKELDNTGTKLAQIFISGGDRTKSLEDFRDYCTILSVERIGILKSNGYPDDYLEPKYKCAKCNDTGYIDNKRCDCFKKRLIKYYYDLSNIAKIIEIENFNNFNYDLYPNDVIENGISARENIEKITRDVKVSIIEMDTKPINMVFSGTSGLGKTYMCNCIAKEAMDSEKSVIYMSAYNLFNNLTKNRFSFDDTQTEQMELLNDCDLLIIDDLGTEGVNVNTITEFFNIINSRFLMSKSTIISTNLSMSELNEIYSERIISRIMGNYKYYKFFGNDIRIFK